ncbi:MAG: SMP-30/gluconolactonase/LRE family protein, partial [Rubripirellula sp.]
METVQTGFAFTEGPAWDTSGNLYFSDIPNSTIHVVSKDGNVDIFTDASRHTNGTLVDSQGRLLACQMDGQVVAYNTETKASMVLADSFDGKRFNAPNDLVIDKRGGIYFTDPLFRAPDPLPQGIQSVYYISRSGKITRVTDHIAAPNGIALSPDGKSLYIAPSHQSE